MYASFGGRLWAKMNGDPIFLFNFSIKYMIKFKNIATSYIIIFFFIYTHDPLNISNAVHTSSLN